MASKSSSSSHLSKQKAFLILSLFSIGLLLSLLSMKPKRVSNVTSKFEVDKRKPSWFDVIEKSIDNKRIKVGLVNVDTRVDGYFQVWWPFVASTRWVLGVQAWFVQPQKQNAYACWFLPDCSWLCRNGYIFFPINELYT